ncbi:MAG: carboxypeptidase-like regulatory domain-containing protein [Thermoanaerobaculia bacterium]
MRIYSTAILLVLTAFVPAPRALAEISVGGLVVLGGEGLGNARAVLLPTAGRHRDGVSWLFGTAETAIAESSIAADGRFQLQAPESGMWKVRVEGEGYVTAEIRLEPLLEAIELPAVALEPARRSRVRVADASGNTLKARVDAVSRAENGGWKTAPRRVATAADGTAILPASGGEALVLTVTAPDFVRQRLETRGGRAVDVVLKRGAVHSLRVVDRDGRAVPGALIFLPGEPWPLALTDEDGRATIRTAVGESPAVEVLAPGGAFANLRVSRNEESAETIVVSMPPTLAGWIVEAGTRWPVPDALVWPEGGAGAAVRADDRGLYEILHHDGSARLLAAAAGYLPGSSELADAAIGPRIELAPAAAPGRTGVGLVVDEDERPITGAEVVLRRAGVAEPPAASTDSRGLFAVPGLAPGRYRLEVEARGFAPAAVPGLEIPGGDGEFDIGVLVLLPGAEISGRVVGTGGEPIAGAEIHLSDDPRSALRPPAPDDAEPPRAFTDGAGGFVVADLRPGEPLSLTIRKTGYLSQRLDAVKAPSSKPVEVVLRRAARISGVVVGEGGEPVAGARVEIAAAADRLRLSVRDATTDAGGRFEIEGVALGSLSLAADADGYLPYRATDLRATEGQSIADLEVTLVLGATIAGRVTDSDGRPVAGAVVLGYPVGERGTFVRRQGTSGEDGRYRLAGVGTGPHRVAAEHQDFARRVREIAVEPGVNELDLELESGAEVNGRVVDATGGPVSGASVTLEDSASSFRGEAPRATSGGDGGFILRGVLDGTYSLVADKEGYARGRGGERFTITAAAPVSGLVVELEAGAALSGYVLGLDFDELARVRIAARGPRGLGARQGRIDYQGRYSIAGLAAGRWVLFAEVQGSGRRAEKTVIVEPGVPEIETDLEFPDGFTLSGRAVQGESPVRGASVRLSKPLFRSGTAVTDPGGGFVIEGLQSGTYQLSLFDLATGLQHRQQVEIFGDREIVVEISGAWISGTVRDRADGHPIAGARLALEPAGGGLAGGATASRFRGSRAESDSNGGFRIEGVPRGSWRLSAQKSGYAPAEAPVEVSSGGAVEGLDLEMEATEGLTFEVVLASGRIPTAVRAAVYDAAGRSVVQGLFETLEDGRVRLDRVPAGNWELALTAEGSANVYLPVTAPGSLGRVRLPPAGRLTVIVPELAAEEASAQITLSGPDGRPFRTWGAGRADAQHLIVNGQLTAGRLTPGTWQVTVTAADGRTWSGSAAVTAAATTTLTLE